MYFLGLYSYDFVLFVSDCPSCRSIANCLEADCLTLILNSDLCDREFLGSFLKSVNALLNSAGGYIVIHAQQIRYLEEIDHKIDPRLQEMLQGKCYHDVFKRYVHKDGMHVVYRIDCSSRSMPPSFHTPYAKVSLNCGLQSASQREAICLVSRAVSQQQGSGDPEDESSDAGDDDEEDMETSDDDNYDRRNRFMHDLVKGAEVKYKKIPFAEDFRIQAKHHVEEHLRDGDSVDKLVDRLWDKWGLPHYISAFSSVPGGGSFYFDIVEDKKKSNHIQSDGGDRRVVSLTKFLCKGVNLNDAEKDQLKMQIKRKLSNMVCIGSQKPGNQLDVLFHPVKVTQGQRLSEPQHLDHQQPSRQMCVVEIKVMEYKHGAVFYRGKGPLVYTIQGYQNPEQVEMTLDYLLEEMNNRSRYNSKSQCPLQQYPFEFQAFQLTASATR